MGRFSKDASWLRKMFPPTGTPATRVPSAVSEDIQLGQDYLAGGQVQDPPLWNHRVTVSNPGNGLSKTVLAPISFAFKGPEVWRVFFMDVSATAPGPTTNLSFDVHIDFPATFRDVMIVRDVSILAGITQGQPISFNAPLILPTDQTGNVGINLSQNLVIKQTAGSGAADVTLQFDYFILRNQKGVAHYL